MSRYNLTRCGNDTLLAIRAAELFVPFVKARARLDLFSVALSGGRISGTLFQSIVHESRRQALDFANVHFFWADERCVSPDHPDSNYCVAAECLFKPLKLSERIHRIKGELAPPDASAEATSEIIRVLRPTSGALPQLDFVFLGMGEDGHVASLFPGGTQCSGETDVYCHVHGPKPPPNRVTLSYSMLATAAEVWVLVTGRGKEKALSESLSLSGATPLGRVIQSRTITHIFVA